MVKRIVACISILAAALALSSPAEAQPATLTAEARQEVVASLSTALRERYVFPEVGAQAAARIGAALAAGEYDGLRGARYVPGVQGCASLINITGIPSRIG